VKSRVKTRACKCAPRRMELAFVQRFSPFHVIPSPRFRKHTQAADGGERGTRFSFTCVCRIASFARGKHARPRPSPSPSPRLPPPHATPFRVRFAISSGARRLHYIITFAGTCRNLIARDSPRLVKAATRGGSPWFRDTVTSQERERRERVRCLWLVTIVSQIGVKSPGEYRGGYGRAAQSPRRGARRMLFRKTIISVGELIRRRNAPCDIIRVKERVLLIA